MLPKTERNRRANKREMEQLGLIDERTLKEKKTKNKEVKRKILMITLGLTIGMSLVFWGYREFNAIDSASILNKIPKINIGRKIEEKQNEQILSGEIKDMIANDQNTWTIGVKRYEKEWSYNENKVNWREVETELSKVEVGNEFIFGTKLPVGIERKIIFNKNKDSYELLVEVKPPEKKIVMMIKVEGREDDLIPTKDLFQEIVEKLYWTW